MKPARQGGGGGGGFAEQREAYLAKVRNFNGVDYTGKARWRLKREMQRGGTVFPAGTIIETTDEIPGLYWEPVPDDTPGVGAMGVVVLPHPYDKGGTFYLGGAVTEHQVALVREARAHVERERGLLSLSELRQLDEEKVPVINPVTGEVEGERPVSDSLQPAPSDLLPPADADGLKAEESPKAKGKRANDRQV